MEYQSLRVPLDDSMMSLTERPGFLRLKGHEGVKSLFRQTLIARRQQSFCYTATTCLEFDPVDFGQSAGLVAWYNTGNFYYLRVGFNEVKGRVLDILTSKDYYITEVMADPIPVNGINRMYLRAVVKHAKLNFYYSEDEKRWIAAGKTLDASALSDECATMFSSKIAESIAHLLGVKIDFFTGAFIGLCCQDSTGNGKAADFDYFEYIHQDAG